MILDETTLPDAVDSVVEAVEAAPMSLIDELKAAMKASEHDVSGRAHALWADLVALVKKVEAAI